MYLAVNIPHQITTLGGVLLRTVSHMIIQILKYTGRPPRLLMQLHVPQICSILLFWQPIIL